MGNGLDKDKLDADCPEINFVSRISYDNGVDGRVNRIEGEQVFDSGLMTVALGGEYLGSSFVQLKPFYTAQNVAVLKPRFRQMDLLVNLFISCLIRYESQKKYFAFGRELNAYLDTVFTVRLPSKTIHGQVRPNWTEIKNIVSSLHYKRISSFVEGSNLQINLDNWKKFTLSKILTITNGKGITKDEIEEHPGELEAIQSGENNNGSLGTIDKEYCQANDYVISDGPCLTVARSGTAGFVAYHHYGCVVGDSAKMLSLPDDIASCEVYLFLQTILSCLRNKYAYGRKVTNAQYGNEQILLPVKCNQRGVIIDSTRRFSSQGYIPDWEYMKSYIRGLKFSDRLPNR
jgi:hypothetical protein